MKKQTKIAFSLLLVVCMLLSGWVNLMPVVAAETNISENKAVENLLTATDGQDLSADPSVEISIIGEDTSLRGEFEKHYLMSDGSYQAVVYSYPVHELVDGVWTEITSTNQNARTDVSPSNAKSNIIDNYVWEGYGVQDNNGTKLYIGNKSGAKARAFIRFATMPTIPEGATITGATMTVNITAGTSTANLANAYQVDEPWESGTIQWSNMPDLGTPQAFSISHNNRTKYQFSCVEAVREWYTGSTTGQNQNYGIMLRYSDESIADYNAFYSADYSVASSRPSLTISYSYGWVDVSIDQNYLMIGQSRYANCTTYSEDASVTWASDTPSVATVDSSGLITARGEGSARISATYYDETSSTTYSDDVLVLVYSSDGLNNGEEYYIMNYNTSRIMSLQTLSDTNSTNVYTRPRSSTAVSKWTLDLQGDGRFQLLNGYSSTGKVLHVSGTNIDIYTDNNSESEKFSICRLTSSNIYSGLYYIRYGSYFLAQDSNNNVYLSTSPTANAIWSFSSTTTGYANYYTQNYAIHDDDGDIINYFETDGNNNYFCTTFGTNFGYSAAATINSRANNAYNVLCRDNQQVFATHGHGDPGLIRFSVDDNIAIGGIYAERALAFEYDTGNDNWFVSDLSQNALHNLRCVIYLGCNTGADITVSGNTYNLVDTTYEKGAHFVLGITESITAEQGDQWMEYFLNYLNDGWNIGEACKRANSELGQIVIPENISYAGENVIITNQTSNGLPIYKIGDEIQYLDLP